MGEAQWSWGVGFDRMARTSYLGHFLVLHTYSTKLLYLVRRDGIFYEASVQELFSVQGSTIVPGRS